jgi:dTDP-4-dehydrorhamnose 3,5-epimerase
MIIEKLSIPEVLLIKPKLYFDDRGAFFESFNDKKFKELSGLDVNFVQDNVSFSKKGVLRGLHFQLAPFEQAKLVQVLKGKVLDVAVDIRENSPSYGKYVSYELSDENNFQLFIPRGFAHGFLSLSEEVIFSYKCDNYYAPDCDSGIIYNDSNIDINWGDNLENLIVSDKDLLLKPLNNI